jgi:hypothetical protein
VSEAQPYIWGESQRIILMLEVKHFSKNCSNTRNVVFLVDTGAPYTVISPTLKKLLLADCNIPDKRVSHDRMAIKIN